MWKHQLVTMENNEKYALNHHHCSTEVYIKQRLFLFLIDTLNQQHYALPLLEWRPFFGGHGNFFVICCFLKYQVTLQIFWVWSSKHMLRCKNL